jgi:hypothetical protein
MVVAVKALEALVAVVEREGVEGEEEAAVAQGEGVVDVVEVVGGVAREALEDLVASNVNLITKSKQ